VAGREAYDKEPGRVLRHASGRALGVLRGRVPAAVVVEALRKLVEQRP